MRFNLTAVFYVITLISAAIATFGMWGIVVAGIVLLFWVAIFNPSIRKQALGTGCGGCVLIVILTLCLLELMFPAVHTAREAVRRLQCSNQLKQIAIALHAYQSDYRTFPPSVVTDADGQPLHSWRLLILPYLEQVDLSRLYDFSLPWNDKANQQVVQTVIQAYQCPTQMTDKPSTVTSYVAIVGSDTLWPGNEALAPRDVHDGLSQTLMVVELPGSDIRWAEPKDVIVAELMTAIEELDRTGRGGLHRQERFFTYTSGGINVAFADGSVRHFTLPELKQKLRAMATISGGEKTPNFTPVGRQTVYVKWNRVISFTLFVILAIAPGFRLFTVLRKRRSSV